MSRRKSPIIIVGCADPAGKWGGTRSYVLSLTRYLESQGEDVLQIPAGGHRGGSISCLLKIFIFSLKLKSKPGMVAIAQRPDDLLMFKLAKRMIPCICVMHGDNLKKMRLKRNAVVYRLYRFMETRGLKAANRIICVDRSTLNAYLERYPDIAPKTALIPVGVDISQFRPMSRERCREMLGIARNAKVMVVAARLEKEKNVEAAIRLVAEHFDTSEHVLLVAGKGKEEERLRKLASRANSASIRFLGQVPYDELPGVICAADVTLVTSLFESGPLIVIESLACGVPVVSTDVGRAREFLEGNRCGRVVPTVGKEYADAVSSFFYFRPTEECVDTARKFSFVSTGTETLKLIDALR